MDLIGIKEKKMSDWIDVNLPFGPPSYEILNYKFLKEFGKSRSEYLKKAKNYNEACETVRKWQNALSFCGMDLNKPGTLIEILEDNGKTNKYLIGNINPDGGCYSDSEDFNTETAIVKRYKIVWSPKDE
jgi:hypothetical protein